MLYDLALQLLWDLCKFTGFILVAFSLTWFPFGYICRSMITKNDHKKPHLIKEWVKYQLGIRGLSFAELARRNGGVRREVPGKAFYMSYPKWERIIATALDMKPEQLWPERYEARSVKKSCGKSTRKRKGLQ